MPRPPSQILSQRPGSFHGSTLVGDDVVQPGADHAGATAHIAIDAHVVAGADAGRFHAAAGQPHRGDHAEGDHQPVGVDGQRADVEHPVDGLGMEARTRDHGVRR